MSIGRRTVTLSLDFNHHWEDSSAIIESYRFQLLGGAAVVLLSEGGQGKDRRRPTAIRLWVLCSRLWFFLIFAYHSRSYFEPGGTGTGTGTAHSLIRDTAYFSKQFRFRENISYRSLAEQEVATIIFLGTQQSTPPSIRTRFFPHWNSQNFHWIKLFN